MIKSIFITILVLVSHSSFSQINLNKVKNRANNKVEGAVNDKKKEKEEERKAEEERKREEQRIANLTPEERQAEEENAERKKSPAGNKILQFDGEIKYARKNIRRYAGDKALDRAEEIMEEIKKLDPNFSGLEKRENELKALRAECESIKSMQDVGTKLHLFLLASEDASEKLWDIELWLRVKKPDFDSLKNLGLKYVNDSLSGEQIQSDIDKLDAFYKNDSPKFVAEVLKDVLKAYERNLAYSDSARALPAFKEGMNSTFTMDSPINDIYNYAKRPSDKVMMIVPENTAAIGLSKKIDKLYNEMYEFRKSDEFANMIAEARKKEIDAVRIGKPGNTDPSLIAIVKKQVNSEKNPKNDIKRVVIMDRTWTIKKTALGQPLYKIMNVSVAISIEDGPCVVTGGFLKKDYNGSSYGTTYFNWVRPSTNNDEEYIGQINCDNIYK